MKVSKNVSWHDCLGELYLCAAAALVEKPSCEDASYTHGI